MSNSDYPVGAVIAFAGIYGANNPLGTSGWTACDGGGLPISSSANSALYGAIGTSYGGDGTDFYVPDYRGRFLRGVDGGAGRDPDAASRAAPSSESIPGNSGDQVGSVQGDQFAGHTHGYYLRNVNQDFQADQSTSSIEADQTTSATTGAAGAGDTRPVNLSVYYFIFTANGASS